MFMAAYKYIKKSIRENLRKLMIDWRAQQSLTKVPKPTDIGRARKLGYKDKKGFVIVRVKIKRGGRKRPKINARRSTKKQTIRKTLKMSYQWVAENRAAKKYRNLEVLNSYKIGKDGVFYFFEVIMVDPNRNEIKKNKNLKFLASPKNKKRSLRGLTSAAKKSRGLRKKSPSLKTRPSLRKHKRKGK